MEDFIYERLRVFKDLTMSLIEAVNFVDTDIILDLLDERQKILDELQAFDREIVIKCSREMEILKLDSLLESLMKNKLNDIYAEIKNLNLERKTVQAYNNSNSNYYSAFAHRV